MDAHTRITLSIVGAVAGLVLVLVVAAVVMAFRPGSGTECLAFLGAAGTGIGGLLAYLSPRPAGAGAGASEEK